MGHSMPLTQGQIVGYDHERLAFKFTILNAGETINCQISDAAMAELIGTEGSPHTIREAQFLAHREAIESLASNLFDAAGAVRGLVVRIFAKHILK
jgi:hypothetical protein